MIKALTKGSKILNENYKKELKAEGHTLTGALEQSIEAKVSKRSGVYRAEGQALHYQKYVDGGTRPEKASFKQFPFLVEYFLKRGKKLKEAKGMAAATIKKWQKEGMPTKASYRFSSNGRRTKGLEAVEKAYTSQVDKAILSGIDQEINQEFHQTKSERI